MNKAGIVFLLFLFIPALVYSQQAGVGLNDYETGLLNEIKNAADEQERHDKLVEAGRLFQLAGDLNRAADMFKQASLAVKGRKDFNSLYRSAVLNVETDFLREAEADLRAIIMFSDDVSLRIKAGVLTAKIKKLQGQVEEAKELVSELLLTYDQLPAEAVRFADELFSSEELANIIESRVKPLVAAAYSGIKPMLNPETVFGGTAAGVLYSDDTGSAAEAIETKTEISSADDENSGEAAVSIQLGSFSVRENAEELQKSVSAAGWQASIKPKTVNGKSYFAVTVPVADGQPVQTLVIKLKEKGFEGYPIY